MKVHKLKLAADMFGEAHGRFSRAATDMDFVVSIMLAGAVLGIIAPLLEEQGGHPTHTLLARIGNVIRKPGDPPVHEGMFRVLYNAMKHAGNDRQKIAPSADLQIDVETDLRLEAAHLLDAAKADFRELQVTPEISRMFTAEFVELLESDYVYA